MPLLKTRIGSVSFTRDLVITVTHLNGPAQTQCLHCMFRVRHTVAPLTGYAKWGILLTFPVTGLPGLCKATTHYSAQLSSGGLRKGLLLTGPARQQQATAYTLTQLSSTPNLCDMQGCKEILNVHAKGRRFAEGLSFDRICRAAAAGICIHLNTAGFSIQSLCHAGS